MAVNIPTTKRKSFFLSHRFSVVLAGIGAVAGAAWSVVERLRNDPEELVAPLRMVAALAPGKMGTDAGEAIANIVSKGGLMWPTLLAFGWILVFTGFSYYAAHTKDVEETRGVSPANKLMGPLVMLEELVRQLKGFPEGDKLFRATLHRVEKDDHEQCLPYVGFKGGDVSKVGRTWSNHCGLVGQIARGHEYGLDADDVIEIDMHADVKDQESYVKALVKLYGYKREVALQHEPMRVSALAVPIKGDSKTVIGVLYCDSSERGFFAEDTTKTLCITAGIAIAKVVKENY